MFLKMSSKLLIFTCITFLLITYSFQTNSKVSIDDLDRQYNGIISSLDSLESAINRNENLLNYKINEVSDLHKQIRLKVLNIKDVVNFSLYKDSIDELEQELLTSKENGMNEISKLTSLNNEMTTNLKNLLQNKVQTWQKTVVDPRFISMHFEQAKQRDSNWTTLNNLTQTLIKDSADYRNNLKNLFEKFAKEDMINTWQNTCEIPVFNNVKLKCLLS